MEPKFKPESVIGVYCFTYPDHEGKDVHTCDHCVELIPEYLTPEAQLALQEGQAYKEALESILRNDERNIAFAEAMIIARKTLESAQDGKEGKA